MKLHHRHNPGPRSRPLEVRGPDPLTDALNGVERFFRSKSSICAAGGCDRPAFGKRWCEFHFELLHGEDDDA